MDSKRSCTPAYKLEWAVMKNYLCELLYKNLEHMRTVANFELLFKFSQTFWLPSSVSYVITLTLYILRSLCPVVGWTKLLVFVK